MTDALLGFDHPALLWLLALALLPLRGRGETPLANGWLALAPRDAASVALGWALRAAAALAVAALVLVLAGPYRPEYTQQRIGRGAEIVIVLDRSRSMDQGFAPTRAAPARNTGPEALDYYFSQTPARLRESKGQAARRLLSEFTARRPDDRFALVVFSTLPMRVLDFTARGEAVQSAIAAGNVGRGLSETHIGLALEAALAAFEGRPYTGSRIVLLVSDGGDRLDEDTRERLLHLTRKLRTSLYWVYLRSANSTGLERGNQSAEADDVIPELALHRFFGTLETAYRAYEASDSQALQRAIEDVDRLEKLPIAYEELVPRRELAPWLMALALGLVVVLLAAQQFRIRRWA